MVRRVRASLGTFAAALAALALISTLPGAGGTAAAADPPGADKLAAFGIKLVLVPGGKFAMGSEDGEDEERPVHEVTLKSFWIGETEITQAQWEAVRGNNPSAFKNCPDCPVETVSWHDAQAFLEVLSKKTGATYRLPTEAEWEYAAGGAAGTRTRWAGTSDEATVGDYAWYADNAGQTTHPVAKKKPNALGLFDMSGNVWEWCQDWHDPKYYANSPSESPPGATRGFARVLRGGSWINSAEGVRVAIRHRIDPDFRNLNLNGLRIAADAP